MINIAFEREKVTFWGRFAAVLGTGLLFVLLPWEKSPYLGKELSEVFPKIGDAFMIAPLIAIFVDLRAAREMLAEFGRNVSGHIVGRSLPAALREHIFGYLEAAFVKKNWTIEYRIERLPQHPGVVCVTTVLNYEITNHSDRDDSYTFVFEVEDSWFPEVGRAVLRRAEARMGHVVLARFNERQLDPTGAETDRTVLRAGNGFTKFSHPIPVPRDATCSFLVESVEYLPATYTAPFIASAFTTNAAITINFPDDACRAFLYLSNDGDMHVTPLRQGMRWIVSTPILTGQSVLAHWRVMDDAAAPSFPVEHSKVTAASSEDHGEGGT